MLIKARRMLIYYCILTLLLFTVNAEESSVKTDSGNPTPIPPKEHVDEETFNNPSSTDPPVTDQAQNLQDEELVQVPYSSSPTYLTHLARIEQQVFDLMTEYENELKKRLNLLQSYRRDYEDSVIQGQQQNGISQNSDDFSGAILVASHPFLTYRMIRRFSKYLNEFNEHIWQSLENELWEKMEKLRTPLAWPAQIDLESAAKSVMRIQDTHDFDINFFSAGVLRDNWIQIGLNAEQCLEISTIALNLGDMSSATEWFQAAHSKVVHGRNDDSVKMEELTEVWEKTFKAFQTVWPMGIFKTHDVFAESKSLLRKEFEKLKVNRTFDNRIFNFKSLCRGDALRSPSEEASLICYLDYSVHPFWLISPLQVEIHNWDPFVYQIHNFIGPKGLYDIIVESAIPSMISSVHSGEILSQNVNGERSFTSTWVRDDPSISPLHKLSRKLELLTHRLGMIGPMYHVSSYAVGNHQEPCVECLEMDNRIHQSGTPRHIVEINLHEPDQGGEKAFTMLGTVVRPIRGSVLMYSAVDAHGEYNDEMLRGNCPVLIGQKWVATKWVYGL